MKAFKCENCSSHEYEDKDGYRICVYCGTKYKIPSAEMPFGTAGINMDSDVQRLLEKCNKDPRNARKYANLVLDIDPNNTEAKKYL